MALRVVPNNASAKRWGIGSHPGSGPTFGFDALAVDELDHCPALRLDDRDLVPHDDVAVGRYGRNCGGCILEFQPGL